MFPSYLGTYRSKRPVYRAVTGQIYTKISAKKCAMQLYTLSGPKTSSGLFHKNLQKIPNELFD